MHCHCGTNKRAPRWTFTDPYKPEVRPGAREESASPAWLAAPAKKIREPHKEEFSVHPSILWPPVMCLGHSLIVAPPPREDAGGLSQEHVLRIPSVS